MANIREVSTASFPSSTNSRRDSDPDTELQSHIDLAVEENISHGMSPEEARRRALIRFGGVQKAKEQQRDAAMPSAPSATIASSLSSPCLSLPSASAQTSLSSVSSTPSCYAHYRSVIQSGWC
jgi:hypothetical protein